MFFLQVIISNLNNKKDKEGDFELEVFEVNKFEKQVFSHKIKIMNYKHVNKNKMEDYNSNNFYTDFKDNFNNQFKNYEKFLEEFKLYYSSGIVENLKFQF